MLQILLVGLTAAQDASQDADGENELVEAIEVDFSAEAGGAGAGDFGTRTAPRPRRLRLDTAPGEDAGPGEGAWQGGDEEPAPSTTTTTTTTTLSPRTVIRVRAGGRRGAPRRGSARRLDGPASDKDEESLQLLASGDVRALRQRQAEFQDTGSDLQDLQREPHTHITRLDVDCSSAGIGVTLEFQEDFSGLVYSKGYYDDPKCR